MERLELFRNMMVMAAMDGSLTEREIALLSERSERWGIDGSEFAASIEHAVSPGAELTVPPAHEDRMQLLEELIRMMAADGHLADVERRLFAVAAVSMGVSADELDSLIDTLLP